MSPRPFLLGDFRVEPALNQLTRGSTSSRVTPKAMEVLVVLAARGGDAVTRDEILDSVWSDVTVNEEVLTRAVADLRKVLDDDARKPRYIETIPKRGYRVVAPVTFVDRDTAPRAARRSALWPAIASALAALGLVALALRSPGSSPRPHRALEAEPLTSLPGREVLPALSPDGTRVAFSWQGASADNWDVYVKEVGSESMVRLTADPAVDAAPVWSSDGRRVAFARYREEEPCRILEVDAAAPAGGGEREIGSCGASQNPDLVSDPRGALLAFSDRDAPDQSFGIYVLERETGRRRKLVSPGGQHWGDKDPAFSPDGRWISFTRSVSMNTQDVYRVPLDGGPPERLTFDGREIRRSAFTADGKAIVVSSARSGHLALWRVPLDGGDPEWLSFAGSSPRSPAVGRGGELVFEDRSGDTDIASVALGRVGEPPGTLVRSTREESEPALSPDGRELAFVSTRSGFPEIWKYDLSSEGGAPVRLTEFGGTHVGSPRWSSDGTRIAFDARPDGHADVYWVPAAGAGKPRRVTSDPSNDLAPDFSRDGRHVYFGSDRSGTWQIWKAPLEEDSRPECVTRNGGYVARSSSDGKSLYFTKFDRAGLFRLDLSTGDEVAVEGADGLFDASLWDLAGDELVFAALDSMTVRVHRRNLTTGEQAEIATVDSRPGGGLAFHSGRGLLLFTRVVRAESDLVLARLPR